MGWVRDLDLKHPPPRGGGATTTSVPSRSPLVLKTARTRGWPGSVGRWLRRPHAYLHPGPVNGLGVLAERGDMETGEHAATGGRDPKPQASTLTRTPPVRGRSDYLGQESAPRSTPTVWRGPNNGEAALWLKL